MIVQYSVGVERATKGVWHVQESFLMDEVTCSVIRSSLGEEVAVQAFPTM